MNITHKINLDMQKTGTRQTMFVMQDDSMSRSAEISLYCDSSVWDVPLDATILQIAYYKPDGTGGVYDTMPDGSSACTAEGNIVTAKLHPQMFSVSGAVLCELRMLNEEGTQLSTFSWYMLVSESATNKIKSKDYFNFASIAAMRKDIGILEDLQTEAKESIVEAINELLALADDAKIHVVRGLSPDGVDYSASGNLPGVAAGSLGKHKGKGAQIVFVPLKTNSTNTPTLKINDGEAIAIRVRAVSNQGDNLNAPDATVAVPVGALMRGVPYTLTFCGKYWLIDSYIPLLACANDEYQAELMREFSSKAMSISESDMIAVPVINSADELPGGSEVGLAQIVRGENEEADPNGSVEIPTVTKVQEIAEQNAGGTKIPIVKEVPADMKDGDIAILQIDGEEDEDGENDGDFVTQKEMEAYVDEVVPEWARQSNKPSYTAEEVGAATTEYVDDAIANFPTGGGVSDMKLLFSLTTTEDTQAIFTGINPKDYREIVMIARAVSSDSTKSAHFSWYFGGFNPNTVYIYNKHLINNGLDAQQVRCFIFQAEKLNDNLWKLNYGGFSQSLSGSSVSPLVTMTTTGYQNKGVEIVTTHLSDIGCGAYYYSNTNLKAGAELMVWGR